MPAVEGSKHISIAAAGNTIIALAKLAAALWTGSAAMMATTVQSLADAISLCIVTRDQPGDHAKRVGPQIFFSSYIVGILVYSLGAGVTITQGIERLRAPVPPHDPSVGILVIAVALICQLTWRWRYASMLPVPTEADTHASHSSLARNSASHTVSLTNITAFVGGLLAIASLVATVWMASPVTEAWASIAIGLTQGFTAASLALSTRAALGETSHPPTEVPLPQSPAVTEATARTPNAAALLQAETKVAVAVAAEPPKRNHPPAQPSRKAKKRRH